MNKIILGIFLFGFNSVLFAFDECSSEKLSQYQNEVINAFILAEQEPYEKVPCDETSESDVEILLDEMTSMVEKIFEGEIPNPVSSALKVFFLPSQTGTSSEFCYVPSKYVKSAEYQLNQYQVLFGHCDQ